MVATKHKLRILALIPNQKKKIPFLIIQHITNKIIVKKNENNDSFLTLQTTEIMQINEEKEQKNRNNNKSEQFEQIEQIKQIKQSPLLQHIEPV